MSKNVIDDCMGEHTEAQTQKIGMTALEFRSLIKPIFFALHKHGKTAFTMVRTGTKVRINIE